MANSCQFGVGTEVDFAKAAVYYEKAVMQGNLGPQHLKIGLFNLGLMYNTGGPGIAVDQNMAIKWWAVGDRIGSPSCVFNLAVMFLNGTGVTKDLNIAISMFQKVRQLEPTFELPHSINALLDEVDRGHEAERRELLAQTEKSRKGKRSKKVDFSEESEKVSTASTGASSTHPAPHHKKSASAAFAVSGGVWEAVGFGVLVTIVVAAFIFATPKGR